MGVTGKCYRSIDCTTTLRQRHFRSGHEPWAAGTLLRSLTEAARRVNGGTTSKSSQVIVAPGLYVLSQMALFRNSKAYTATDRLVIRAEVLPHDPTWHPQQMLIVLTAVPLVADEC